LAQVWLAKFVATLAVRPAMPPKENVSPNVKTAAPASDGKKKKGKAAAPCDDAFLSAFRPRKRFVVFAAFLAICGGTMLFHDSCDVRKKKQDCGWSGISALECRTTACFTKGGGDMDKKKIKLKRKKGTKFGIVSGSKKDESWVFIKAIKEGAVADHNAQAAEEDRIYPSDSISSIDGATGGTLRKSLASTNTESVSIEIRRTKLPSYLRWIHTSSKPNFVEKIMTAHGSKSWFDAFTKLGGLGVTFWFVSGYPAVSLPFYYLGLSSVTAWHMSSRCCHDEKVAGGVPHCYKGGSAKFGVAMGRLQTRSTEMLAKVQKDPRSYYKWLFALPDGDVEKWYSMK